MAWYREYHVMFACIATAMIYPHLSYFSWYILKFDQIPMISYSVNISDSTRLPQDVEHQESASAQEPSGQVARCGVCSYSWQLRMADVVWQSHHKSAWIPGLEVAFAKCSQSRWTAWTRNRMATHPFHILSWQSLQFFTRCTSSVWQLRWLPWICEF